VNEVSTKTAAGLLALTGVRGVGPATAERIAERFSSLNEIAHATPKQLRMLAPGTVMAALQERHTLFEAITRAQRVLDAASNLGVRVLSVFDQDYPVLLRAIPDRPTVIYVKGRLDQLERAVASIGTREPSEFGEQVATRIVEQLVDAGWAIVSGLAIGIDTISHAATLGRGGRTIAVMAGGLDQVYPKQNTKLAERILDMDGALISEQPFGTPAIPRNLVQRDRLQSGLSLATFVMQTDIKGGSMHTVRFTLQQGRLLFAPLPTGRHAVEPKSQGILALTQMTGAKFADVVGADGSYASLLRSKFYSRPVATALASKEDYASVISTLNEAFQLVKNQAPFGKAQPSFL